MQKIFEKKNCIIVFVTLELLGNNTFSWRSPIRGNLPLFSLPLKALVSVKEQVSVEDAPFHSVSLRSGMGR